MPELITCTPRTLPPDKWVDAARRAIEINPQNRPAVEQIAAAMPDTRALRPEELAVATAKYWGAGGVRLIVGFLDGGSAELRKKILSHMNAWNETANVEFVETGDAEDADVRINRERMPDDEWNGYWSFLGTDIQIHSGPNNQTMNLEAFTMQTPDSEFYRVVRHETGHTLGFPHEHMRKDLVERIDRDKAISYYRRRTGWTEDQVIRQVLTPLDPSALIATSVADPDSIMCYQIPGHLTTDGKPILGGTDINESDYKFAALIYPK